MESWLKESSIYQMKIQHNVPFLTFRPWNTFDVIHGFSLREGGVSTGIFRSMNLSYQRGDTPENVSQNYERMGKALGVPFSQMVGAQLVHSTNVHLVQAEDVGNLKRVHSGVPNTDGLMTNKPGVCLVTTYADCVPLYFYDPIHQAIALSHAGWRGTVAKMGEVTLNRMAQAFKTVPKDVYCAIGPSICQECYEVSTDVYEAFQEGFTKEQITQCLYPTTHGHWQLNLWKANEIVLRQAGIREEHLIVNTLCTCCHKEQLFSHRGSKGKRGNLAAFLALPPSKKCRKEY